jgi:hypothetical protein
MRLRYIPPRWNKWDWTVVGHYQGRHLAISDYSRYHAGWRVVLGLKRGERN